MSEANEAGMANEADASGLSIAVGADGPVEVTPIATDEEMAAILAAYEALWPKPQPAKPAGKDTAWRFSGRWFARPRFPR